MQGIWCSRRFPGPTSFWEVDGIAPEDRPVRKEITRDICFSLQACNKSGHVHRNESPQSSHAQTVPSGKISNTPFGDSEPAMDRLISAADSALRTLFAVPRASRPCPTLPGEASTLDAAEQRDAGALMRVNHVGEICAQALYASQALATRNPGLRTHFDAAAREETDHLAWTQSRMDELGARPSLLNPLWYAGAFGIGLLAGKLGGDRVSLGFVVETERQVEAHLASHMERLPQGDHASRAIVAQMKDDEARHAAEAQAAGGMALPAPLKHLMRAAAKLMTVTAERI
jgi:ubiquinone biosynthesis monooxygenase Coq7